MPDGQLLLTSGMFDLGKTIPYAECKYASQGLPQCRPLRYASTTALRHIDRYNTDGLSLIYREAQPEMIRRRIETGFRIGYAGIRETILCIECAQAHHIALHFLGNQDLLVLRQQRKPAT